MKTSGLIAHVSALMFACGSALAQGGAPATPKEPIPTTDTAITGPQIVFESERLTFGKVLDTDAQTVTFKFRNVGSAELRVGEATTAIDTVMVMPMAKRTFASGESGELVVRIDPQKWRGPITTRVRVPSNSPGRPVDLLIDGFVEKTVNVEPTIARLGWIKPGQTGRAALTITGRTPDFKVTGAKLLSVTGGPMWNVQVGEPVEVIINDQTLRRVVVEMASIVPLPEGMTEDTLEISTNDPRRPTLNVLVRGWVSDKPPPKVDAVPVMNSGGEYQTGQPVRMPKRDPNDPNHGGQPATPPSQPAQSKPE